MNKDYSRKHIRFSPDENTLIEVSLPGDKTCIGLAYSEAYGGFAGVFIKSLSSESIKVDDVFPIKIGHIDCERAQVRWAKVTDENLIEIGFQILD